MHIMRWWEYYYYYYYYYYYCTVAFHSAYVLQESESSYNYFSSGLKTRDGALSKNI